MARGNIKNFGAKIAPPFKARGTTAMMRKGDNVPGPKGRATIPAPVRSVHGVKTVNTQKTAVKGGRK